MRTRNILALARAVCRAVLLVAVVLGMAPQAITQVQLEYIAGGSAVTNDGMRSISGGRQFVTLNTQQTSVAVWDSGTATASYTFTEPFGQIDKWDASRDGSTVVYHTANYPDQEIVRINVNSHDRRVLFTLNSYNPVNRIAVSPSGRRVLVATGQDCVVLDTITGHVIAAFVLAQYPNTCTYNTETSFFMCSGAGGGSLRCINDTNGAQLWLSALSNVSDARMVRKTNRSDVFVLQGTNAPYFVARLDATSGATLAYQESSYAYGSGPIDYDSISNKVVILDAQGRVARFNPATLAFLSATGTHDGTVASATILASGSLLVPQSSVFNLYDINSGASQGILPSIHDVARVSWRLDGSAMVSSALTGSQGNLESLTLGRQSILTRIGYGATVSQDGNVYYSNDGGYMVARRVSDGVELWRTDYVGTLYQTASSLNGLFVAVASSNGEVYIARTDTGVVLSHTPVPSMYGFPQSISWNTAGTRVLVGNAMIQAPAGGIIREFSTGTGLSPSAFTKDGSQVIVGVGGILSVFDTESGFPVKTINVGPQPVAMSSDPRLPVVALGFGTGKGMKLVNYDQSLVELDTTDLTGGGVRSVSYSSDGTKIAMGCIDGSIAVITNPIAYRAFHITSSLPARSAAVPSLHMSIDGTGCEQCTRVTLERNGVQVAEATNIRAGFFKIECDFNVSGLAQERYDVVGYAGPIVDRIQEALEIKAAGSSRDIVVGIDLPRFNRPDRENTATVSVTNVGVDPVDSPYYRVTASNGAFMRMTAMDPWSLDPIYFLATGGSDNHRLIYPGETIYVPIRFKAPAYAQGHWITTFTVEEITSIAANAFSNHYAAVGAALAPSGVHPTAWALCWDAFVSQLGFNFESYMNAMRNAAQYFGENGEQVYDAKRLFKVYMARATSDITPIANLDASVDAGEAAKGISLALGRFAPAGIDRRYRLGPFGRGWSHGFEYKLLVMSAAEVQIVGPGDGRREFHNEDGHGYKGHEGDQGKLVQLEGGGYTLTEADGTAMAFDAAGIAQSFSDSNGNTLTLGYSGGRLSSIHHSCGAQLDIQYNASGRITSVTDSTGRATTYEYDGTGEFLTRVTYPGGRQTTYTYNPTGAALDSYALRQVVYPGGSQVNYTYDGAGRVATVSGNGGASLVTFEYPGFGQFNVVDANGKRSYGYQGSAGQLLRAVSPLGSAVKTKYDDAFRPTQVVGPLNETSSMGYDFRGNTLFSTDPENRTLNAEYTTDYNRLDWLRDARLKTMDFTYDAKGNTTRITHPGGSHQDFVYNLNGDATDYTTRNSNHITYSHNARGQLTGAFWPDGRTFTYAYDARGNLTSAADSATGTIAMQYDVRDFLTRVGYPGGKWFEYDYDQAGRRTQRRSNDGFVLNYLYDSLGRLYRVTDGFGASAVTYAYDAVGRLASETKGNGTFTTYGYDNDGHVTHIQHAHNGGTATYSYQYDASGNPTSLVTPDGTYLYGYDKSGQLTSFRFPSGQIVTYTYDAAGNRISETGAGGPISYAVNDLNQYAQVGATQYGYDLDGNLAQKIDQSGVTTCTYDIAGRLTSVSRSGFTESYTYDAVGNRVKVITNGTESDYVFDGSLIASELDGGGALKARYVHGLGLVSKLENAGAYYYDFDLTGNTRQVTAPNGSVANRYDYQPFGLLVSSVEGIANPFQYVGRYGVVRDLSGLHWMSARHYDAVLGRFVQPDPTGLAGDDANLYRYAENSANSVVDPTGLACNDPRVADFLRPTAGGFNNGFGMRFHPVHHRNILHEGIDYNGKVGAPVYAVAGGTAYNGWNKNNGFYIRIYHGGGLSTVYAHLSKRFVGDVQEVRAGERIGLVGKTGKVTGPHLHFGVKEGRSYCDPTSNSAWKFAEEVGGDGSPVAHADTESITSADPNEKLGPAGILADGIRYLGDNNPVDYQVRFENVGLAHAQKVVVTDFLDPDLDWSTFQLGAITFGNTTVNDPIGFQQGSFLVPIAPPVNPEETNPDNSNLLAMITVTYDRFTGKTVWTIEAIDPLTMQPPNGVYQGVLARNGVYDAGHEGDHNFYHPYTDGRGEGKVVFSITPRHRPDGTYLTNKASIVFDTNTAIETNTWENVLDLGPPVSSVTPLPALSLPSFNVTWGGYDIGSGIASYDVYVSENGGAYTLWQHDTTDLSAVFISRKKVKTTYRFYSVAKDNLGHVEAAPIVPDAATQVGLKRIGPG